MSQSWELLIWSALSQESASGWGRGAVSTERFLRGWECRTHFMAVLEFGSKKVWTGLRRSRVFPIVSSCRGKTNRVAMWAMGYTGCIMLTARNMCQRSGSQQRWLIQQDWVCKLLILMGKRFPCMSRIHRFAFVAGSWCHEKDCEFCQVGLRILLSSHIGCDLQQATSLNGMSPI